MRLERLVRLSSSPPVPEQQRQKYERHARAAASGLHRLRAAKASTRSLVTVTSGSHRSAAASYRATELAEPDSAASSLPPGVERRSVRNVGRGRCPYLGLSLGPETLPLLQCTSVYGAPPEANRASPRRSVHIAPKAALSACCAHPRRRGRPVSRRHPGTHAPRPATRPPPSGPCAGRVAPPTSGSRTPEHTV